MPRYRVNVPFGPWRRGEEFESTDGFHEVLASSGKLLEIADAASAGAQPGAVGPPPEDRLEAEPPAGEG